MRVLFLSQIVPYPPHGGVLQRGFNLVRELGRHAKVDLLAFVHPDELQTAEAVDESRRVLQQFCDTVEYFELWPKQSKGHRLAALAAGAASTQPFSVIAHRSAAFRRAIAAAVRRNPPDLIHVDTIALAPFRPAGAGIPSVLTHHNIESMLMARRSEVEHGAAARWYLRREAAKLRAFEASQSPTFDVNIVMSEPDGAALHGIAPSARVAVVPNGVDVDYFTPQPERETMALIYGGGMNMFANRDAVMFFLEEIWPAVREAVPEVTFYAVGQDPPPELQAIAARDPRVVVTGKVKDIRPYIWQAAVYVVPLRVGGGTRLKVLDAMAMGKAMVSTPVGCEGIEVRDGEHLVVADGPEAFAKSTIALLGDRARRLELGRAARRLVEQRYAWSVIGRSLLEAYGRATSGSARAPRASSTRVHEAS